MSRHEGGHSSSQENERMDGHEGGHVGGHDAAM